MSFPSNTKYPSPKIPLETLFSDFLPETKEPLEILCENEVFAVVVGRDESTHIKNGLIGLLYIGLVAEYNSEHFGKKILVDSLSPHKIFISGKTGSGKSYTLGVFAEELAEQNLGIGTVIVDPMGTFWSMKYPKTMEEGDLLDKWGLSPKKYDNIHVFIPIQLRNRYSLGTFDDVFSIRPDLLTAEDWANTFGIDFFTSPQSGLIIETINYLSKKPKNADGSAYSIKDIVDHIERNEDLQEKYHSSTIRAVKTRFEASTQWGIFSPAGTPIHKLSMPNQISIVDVSLLNEKTRALVVGILAKQILNERTRIARHDKIQTMIESGSGTNDCGDIPVTWLLVDEAHTLAPSRGKTAASEPLVEYAKRGRMPGCALVLATQQPSATSDEILSQIDILISHNLSFSQDILELKKRTPSKLPTDIGSEGFIRNLPVGAALISDQSTTTKRTFVSRIRPRKSPHGGSSLSPIAPSRPQVSRPYPESTLDSQEIEQKPLEPVDVHTAPETSQPTLIETESEPNTPESVSKPVPFSGEAQEILSKITIPYYDLPEDIASDYLERFMSFRILYKELLIKSPKISISTVNEEKNSLVNAINGLFLEGYKHETTKEVEGNPIIILSHEKTSAAMSIIRSNQNTIYSILK